MNKNITKIFLFNIFDVFLKRTKNVKNVLRLDPKLLIILRKILQVPRGRKTNVPERVPKRSQTGSKTSIKRCKCTLGMLVRSGYDIFVKIISRLNAVQKK